MNAERKSFDEPLIPHGACDILFVNAPHFNVLFPPSGIAYLCEAVKGAGFVPRVVDLNNTLIRRYRNNRVERFWHVERSIPYWMGEDYPEVEAVFGDDFDAAADALAGASAPVLGFSVNMLNLKTTDRIVARIRERAPEKVVVYGGYSCYHDEVCRTLSSLPDYISVGESEGSVVALMEALRDGSDPGSLPGIMDNKDQGRFVPATREENLDRLSWPRWEEFDLTRYRTLQPFITVSVNASRGCAWGRCHFCSDFNATPGFRRRSAESLVEEIRYSYERHGVGNFHLSDLIVNGDHEELERFADLLIEAGMTIAFSGQFHLDKRMTLDLMKKLKRAGMPIINFGMETGSNRMMKLMRKGHNVSLAERCLRDATEAGLVTDVNLLVGFPGETEEDVDETEAFMRKNRSVIDIVEVVNICSIQYGSPLWAQREQFGVVFDERPGVREERFWVSADGANTFEERVRRATRLQRLIEELGIGKGYHSQEFSFVGEGEPVFDPRLYRSNLAELWRKANLEERRRALVLRSCGVEQMEILLESVGDSAPGTVVDLLCQETSLPRFADKVSGEVIPCPGGDLSIENVGAAVMERLASGRYDAVILPYGIMPSYTYRHVMRLARETGAPVILTILYSGSLASGKEGAVV